MPKLTEAQQNDEYMASMRAKGYDTIFVSELPFPSSTRGCTLILATHQRKLYIRDAVA